MSRGSGTNWSEEISVEGQSDEAALLELLGWGKLLTSLVELIDPFCQMVDLLQTDHPLRDSDRPLGSVVRCFGRNSGGEQFLTWWTGGDESFPPLADCESIAELLPLALGHKWKVGELKGEAEKSFQAFHREWGLKRDRLVDLESEQESPFSRPLSDPDWDFARHKLSLGESDSEQAGGADLDDAIERVRSYFAPLESPLFGMDTEMLAHHVQETIPRERPAEAVTPIVPLFGKGRLNKAFPSTAQLPAHLRVILHRLLRSQENQDLVTSLLATLEAVDFSLRFAAGIAHGTWAQLTENDFSGDFNPTTAQLITDLGEHLLFLGEFRADPRAQAAVNLFFQGELHPFLAWSCLGENSRLLTWMMEAEDTIRDDNPARAAALLSEIMEPFNEWVSELVLLCSSWDQVIHVRQDGYLQISLGRGEVWLSCKPLIDPTRYSVWLDRSELTLVNKGGSLQGLRNPKDPVESLDDRIRAVSDDPPFLKEQLGALVRAHQQGQILPLGRALFFGLEYLVRLHASLAGGFLRHFYDEAALVDPVLKESGSLEHTIFFLSYSQRLMNELGRDEAYQLRQVFFDQDRPRDFTYWLGLDGGVPGPLQGLLGWNLSLMRPDAKTRLDEVRGQVERLSSLFADFLEESRQLWRVAKLKTDANAEGAEAIVLTFPSGLTIRGIPDVAVGPRMERGRRSVVVCREESEDEFSDWEGEHQESEPEEPLFESAEEPSWPSFFDDESEASQAWSREHLDAISRVCQSRSFSGPEARPRRVAQEMADFVTSSASASLMFCQGVSGAGKTFLCRTLTNPDCSPLPEDFPVLYLRVDRFPKTRLATVVERLNDHIASEQSLERFEWCSVPLNSLKALGTEMARMADDLSALGVASESLANRLTGYLRHLKKLNGDREFLLILDGFEKIPSSIVPKALPRGVHLLLTGTSLPRLEEPQNAYLSQKVWNLSEAQKETFCRQLQGMQLKDEEKDRAWNRFGGSLFLGRVFRDLRDSDPAYPIASEVVADLFALVRAQFTVPEKFQEFVRLLAVLGLYDRPVPLATLQKKIGDSEVVSRGVKVFPSLFAFWEQPHPSLGLAHRLVLDAVREVSDQVELVAGELAEAFLKSPRRGELLPALSWFVESSDTVSLVDRFFTESSSADLWREELGSLQEQGLFFHRVALLDAVAEPLAEAVAGGAGHLLEELAWVHNARGLSLLELGLVEEAVPDFQKAIEYFTEMFEAGDLRVLQAMASAHSRMSEASLKHEEVVSAQDSSRKAQELLSERDASPEGENSQSLTELKIRVMLQGARACLAGDEGQEALDKLSSIRVDLDSLPEERAKTLSGECFLVAAQAMVGMGLHDSALEQVGVAVDQLLVGSTAELGLQALTLRARLYRKLGRRAEADRDYQRAVSIIRYQVAVGRLDLEPLLAYTAAQAAQVGDLGSGTPESLTEFVEWAHRRIRLEGRTDLRGLLAYLLLTRGGRWREFGNFVQAAQDFRAATEQYDLLSREVRGERDQPVWAALRRSFRNLTSLYLSLDEAHLALMCGRRALELGRRGGTETDSAEESMELPFQPWGARNSGESSSLADVRFFQLGELYFHLGEAARRVGLEGDGATYFQRSARALAQSCSSFEDVPEALASKYALVLKFAAQAAFEDGDNALLEEWVDELASLPDGYLTAFDQYRFWRWSGYVSQAQGNHNQSLSHFQRALKVVPEMSDHPRWRTFEVEALLDLGRVRSLLGEHDQALRGLDMAAQKGHDALFSEGEESRELLVRCALHSAVAKLRAGQTVPALDNLRVLVSFRPGLELHDVESLAFDWVEAWRQADRELSVMDLLKALGQLSELGDWLLRTSLGDWYRELSSRVVLHEEFSQVIMSSSRVDRILETYLILTFSRVGQDTRPESHPELDRLLAAKFRAFDSENRDLEAELIMGHLLPLRLTPEAGKLLLRRSEMALLRGDRGLAIVDLLRAIDGGGECRLRAHLRLAEFLQSRELSVAATHHLLRALQATDRRTEELSSLCGRFNRVLTGLSKSGAKLELSFFAEYFRVLTCLEEEQLKPNLEVAWLRPARDQREWSRFLEMSLDLVLPWQQAGHDKGGDWDFLEQLMDRTVLCQGRLELSLLEKLGKLLGATLSGEDVQNQAQAVKLWERFVSFLPGLGKRNALDLLQRLFDFTLRTEQPSNQSHVEEFLRLLEEEKRILIQPR